MSIEILQQMSGNKRKIKVLDKELEVEPLTLNELAKFSAYQTKQDVENAMQYLIKTTLIKIDGVTEELINKLDPKYVEPLTVELLKLNGLKIDDSKKKSNEN